MIRCFNIPPKWNILDYTNLDYKVDFHKDQELVDTYVKAGHSKSAIALYNYFEPNLMPDSMTYIKGYFNLQCTSVAVNKFTPGQYLPVHCDLYRAYKTHYNLDNNQVIYRYIIMLEDGTDGQMLTIENDTHTMWKAGDAFGWKDCDKHTFYNMSLKDRYAVQLTGIQTQ